MTAQDYIVAALVLMALGYLVWRIAAKRRHNCCGNDKPACMETPRDGS